MALSQNMRAGLLSLAILTTFLVLWHWSTGGARRPRASTPNTRR